LLLLFENLIALLDSDKKNIDDDFASSTKED
jgi:hypothetical protein